MKNVTDYLNEENNRFRLVLAASKRARQIAMGYQPLVENRGNKPTVLALREIDEGKTTIAKILQQENNLNSFNINAAEKNTAAEHQE